MRNITCPRSCFAYLDFCKHSFMTLISTFNFCAYSIVQILHCHWTYQDGCLLLYKTAQFHIKMTMTAYLDTIKFTSYSLFVKQSL